MGIQFGATPGPRKQPHTGPEPHDRGQRSTRPISTPDGLPDAPERARHPEAPSRSAPDANPSTHPASRGDVRFAPPRPRRAAVSEPPRPEPSRAVQTLWCAGVAGGVGTTTFVALAVTLLRDAGVSVNAADHGGGDLAARIGSAPAAIGAGTPSLRESVFGPSGDHGLQLVDSGRLTAGFMEREERGDVARILLGTPQPEHVAQLLSAREHLVERGVRRERIALVVVDPLRCGRTVLNRAASQAALAVGYDRILARRGPLETAHYRSREARRVVPALAELLARLRAA